MTEELKTLKDLGGEDEYTLEDGVEIEHESFWVSRSELIFEAIKWVKELEDGNVQDDDARIGAIEFILNFFNLTAEDLT